MTSRLRSAGAPPLSLLPYDEPPEPPAELLPEDFAARLYRMLGPLTRLDSETDWSLLILVNAIGTMYELVEDLVRDTPDGPGWSILLDLDRCPDAALPWLAQFVGVRLPSGLTVEQQRALIAAVGGFKRGTLASIEAAAAATLTGARTVFIVERSGDPVAEPIDYAYYLSVTTYASQTPDPAKTEAAILAEKPGGIVLDYRVVPGQTWQQVKDSGRTWAQVSADYSTWNDVRSDEPA